MRLKFVGAILACAVLAAPAKAEDSLVSLKLMAPDTALELARAAMQSCRKQGYQVAVAVVDRLGVPQVLLRDQFAGAIMVEIAIRKAKTAASFRANTAEIAALAKPGTQYYGLYQVPGALVLGGGMIVQAAGSTVGAIGVSGAPGPNIDDDCAKAAIEALADKLNF